MLICPVSHLKLGAFFNRETIRGKAYVIFFTVTAVSYEPTSIDSPKDWGYNYYIAYKQLGAGLCCGLSSLAAGLCIGVVGDAGVRGNAQRDILIALILMMIFAEALALYGFIVAIVLVSG